MPETFTRIITINLNDIRSAAGKGFYEWLAQQEANIIQPRRNVHNYPHNRRSN
ncbi:MAG: hypothetical protein NUV75_02495 [Gallionella sp.]|nr:hypothetical protein [Gallionella sp.]